MRLDVYLTAAGKAKSRTQAKEWIEGGFVVVSGKVVRKASYLVDETTGESVEVTGAPHPFVGRGGVKLQSALDLFSVDPTGWICVDVGASTGGFTDCLLRAGAAAVYAVDSGRDQLAESLRRDSRVVNIEQFNARNLGPETLGVCCDLAVADLSFISQTYVLANISSVLRECGMYIGLIKPQFECGAAALDRHGIVKSARSHKEAILRVRDAAAGAGLEMLRVIRSPIDGGDGNREFLCLCVKKSGAVHPAVTENMIDKLVNA